MVRMGSESIRCEAIEMSKVRSETTTQSLQTTHSQVLLSFYEWHLCTVCLLTVSSMSACLTARWLRSQKCRHRRRIRRRVELTGCVMGLKITHAWKPQHMHAFMRSWRSEVMLPQAGAKSRKWKKKVATGEVRGILKKIKQKERHKRRTEFKKKISLLHPKSPWFGVSNN